MIQNTIPINDLKDLITDILINHNTSRTNALQVAEALVAAEIDGQKGHGLSRVASYAAQAKSGKVMGQIKPSIAKVAPSLLIIDAHHGFAYPAINLALDSLAKLAKETGIAAAAVSNSHHCGVMGHHTEKLAQQELIGLAFSNSPKAIAPWGGKDAIFGTNPIAFAAPCSRREPLVIDLSLSKVARGKIKVAAQNGEAIPEGWALDAEGNPTSDANAAMAGSMLPMGEAKGAALVLMVEILSAAISASHFGYEASSFFDAEGPAPGIGQLFLAIFPDPLSSGRFTERVGALIETILSQPGTRLPGSGKAELRKQARDFGVKISQKVWDDLLELKKL